MSETARQVLRQNKMSVTEPRMMLLDLFLEHNEPLSYAFIRRQSGKGITRFTLHRTLKMFLGKQLIHGTLNENGVRTYSFGYVEEKKQVTRLQCKECGLTYTVACLPVEKLAVLKKYSVERIDILLKGICEACNKKITLLSEAERKAVFVLTTTLQLITWVN